MSVLSDPGLNRVVELYNDGFIQRDIAEDEELRETLLYGIDNPVSRKFKVSHTIDFLKRIGVIGERDGTNIPKKKPTKSEEYSPNTTKNTGAIGGEDAYYRHLSQYEEFIGAKEKRKGRECCKEKIGERTETIIISDTHIPDERMDLLGEIALRHSGAHCVLAGDLNDFQMFGRFDLKDWTLPNLQASLSRTDAVLGFLTEHFDGVDILMGNHDLRLPRKAAKQLGPEYNFITQEFLLSAYEKRHGARVIRNIITKENGRDLPGLYFYHQVGDCVIGHVEAGGKPVGASSKIAHDFFFSRRKLLGLTEFKLVLQAHSHRQSFFIDPLTGVHCYEIGALCTEQAYSIEQPKYGPMQKGYYHLVQYGGITDIDESRLYSFE